MQKEIHCWCGNDSLSQFSAEYKLCKSCMTLASIPGLSDLKTTVSNDDEDFYGKNYWLNHQSEDLGQATIFERARRDLSERCLYWLRSLLRFRLPEAKVLEIGCAHGGFTSLLRNTGYDASGLELSPYIAEFARQSFDIPMYVGPIEDQNIEAGSLDIIILMDVLEHLADPVTTIQNCLKLLKEDGLLVMQTPAYPKEHSYASLLKSQHAFLNMMQSQEHLYLFSIQSVEHFFQKITPEKIYLEFEPAIFSQYDMYFVASRKPLVKNTDAEVEKYLSHSAKTRQVQTLLDLAEQRDNYIKLFQQADADRVARLAIIEKLNTFNRDDIPAYIPII